MPNSIYVWILLHACSKGPYPERAQSQNPPPPPHPFSYPKPIGDASPLPLKRLKLPGC